MQSQQGFQYEKNASDYLKKLNLVEKTFNPVGSLHDRPDLEITYNGKTEGVELKITAASAGSLVLKYDEKKPKNQRWGFADTKNDPEKAFLVSIAKKVGALNEINRKWNKIPLKRDVRTNEEKLAINKIPSKKRYEIDHTNFPEINKDISALYIAQYYNEKHTFYVNVGTHGFYLMGPKDPFELNRNLSKHHLPLVPDFAKIAKAKFRARVQYKGNDNYQFTFELSFSISSSNKSPYNIAPVSGKSVTIDKSKVNTSCFI